MNSDTDPEESDFLRPLKHQVTATRSLLAFVLVYFNLTSYIYIIKLHVNFIYASLKTVCFNYASVSQINKEEMTQKFKNSFFFKCYPEGNTDVKKPFSEDKCQL